MEDLKTLSKVELDSKWVTINNTIQILNKKLVKLTRDFNDLCTRRWVNPIKILTIQSEIEEIKITLFLLNEYYDLINKESLGRTNSLYNSKTII